jgi:AraC-like DNA-binding protein
MGIRVGLVAGADAFRPLLDFADRGTTLAEVIDRAIDVLAWHCNAFTTSLRIAGERVRWSIAYAEFAPAAVAQHAARPLIQMAQLVRRHGGDAARIEIEFDGLPIAERQRAETLLGIAVQPVAGATAVTFPAQWLGGSPGIPASHRATAPTPDYAECPLPATIAEAVRCVLDLHAEAPACDIEQVSAELGSSRRMLQYGLAGEGTNFRDILRNARIDHARHLLANSAIPIAEIAVEVGYYDQANFHRAFFGTTGQTPRHYREAFRG